MFSFFPPKALKQLSIKYDEVKRLMILALMQDPAFWYLKVDLGKIQQSKMMMMMSQYFTVHFYIILIWQPLHLQYCKPLQVVGGEVGLRV